MPEPAPVTAIIIARNSAATITECVRALAFCRDVIVGENGSVDATAALAREAGATVLPVVWSGYGATKNELAGRVRDGWVLSIDADEVVPPELAMEIRAAIARPEAPNGFWIGRRNFFLGREMRFGGWSPDRQLRLFRAGTARFEERPVHEALRVQGETHRLRHRLKHYTYATLTDYLGRLNHYTRLAARERLAKGRRFSLSRLCFDPLWVFIRMYGLRSGWRDGTHGFLLAALSALNTLVKHAKVWEASQTGRPDRGEPKTA